MYVYIVSFELKNDITYDSRYRSLMRELRAGTCWEETTSFALVETPEAIDAFFDRLYYKSEIIDSKDLLLVIDTTSQAARVRGPVKYPATLHALLPYLKNMALT